ncbi:alpha/beta-hydrolase [Agrocybe pediades]|nr:alpha/beta-hydrolase [Agrocybe pediades]
MPLTTKPYGAVSFLDRIKTIFVLLPLPLVTVYRLVASRFLPYERRKSWKRVLTDTSFRYISSSLSVNQMQNMMGTTLGVYKEWTKKNGMPYLVDEIGEDARLMWFGERETENVILYIHGGVYCLPLQDFAASFWKYAVNAMKQNTGRKIGFVALNYSLTPTAYFPTQLKQTILALNHLLSLGVRPENIQVAGESAGGALVLQLLSHILHPVPDLPLLPKGIKLGGACIMSPWVSLTGNTGSHLENSDSDVLPAKTWAYLGEHTLPALSDASRPYLQAIDAPEGWFKGVDRHVRRVLVTVGERECLRDDVLKVARKLETATDDAFLSVFVHVNGVHNDQYLDFMAGEKQLGDLTPQLIGWLEKGLH